MYRLAVLGCGRHGKGHAWNDLPDCRIVAVCDLVEERARERADMYGVPFYLDAEEMLDKEEIDIVDVPVRETDRFDAVMKCLERDKHVYTEKPLGGEEGQLKIRLTDIPKVRAMVDEWQKHDVQFGVCFTTHGDNNVRWAKQLIHSGDYGNPMVVSARCARGTWTHLVDMFRYLGGEVDEVFAHGDEDWRSKTVTVRFENGAIGTLMTCITLPLQYEIKWIGEKGEVQIGSFYGGPGSGRARFSTGQALPPMTEDRVLTRMSGGGREQHRADFVESIKEHRPFVADGWAGLRHMEIDAAISESLVTHHPVKVERYKPENGRTVFWK